MEIDPKNSNAYHGIGKNDCLKNQTFMMEIIYKCIWGKNGVIKLTLTLTRNSS